MTDPGQRAVVITGASTGIGAACALDLVRHGFQVFAGVRRKEDGEALRRHDARLVPLPLDVTDERSVRAACDLVEAAVTGAGLAGLVNNAGIAVAGPLEALPLDALRRQLEVNVVGQVAVTQTFLPLLRRGHGRIVNIGSIAGRAAMPFMGAYSASKYALEAVTDALRLELRPWGIRVSIIEPGAIATPIWEKSGREAAALEAGLSADMRERYAPAVVGVKEAVRRAAVRAIPPAAVAAAVRHALTARWPKTRYVVGWDAKIRALMVKILPDRVTDWLLAWALKLPQ